AQCRKRAGRRSSYPVGSRVTRGNDRPLRGHHRLPITVRDHRTGALRSETRRACRLRIAASAKRKAGVGSIMKSSHETKNHQPCKSSEGHRHVFATHDITLIEM